MASLFMHAPTNATPETLASANFYERLGVSSDDSILEIQRTYRQLILKYHPDRYPNATTAQREALTRSMQRLNEAASTLLDNERRAIYDRNPTHLRRRPATSTRTTRASPPEPQRAGPIAEQGTTSTRPSHSSVQGRIIPRDQQGNITQPDWARRPNTPAEVTRPDWARRPNTPTEVTQPDWARRPNTPTEVTQPDWARRPTPSSPGVRSPAVPAEGACSTLLNTELNRLR